MKLEEHPTVKWFRQHAANRTDPSLLQGRLDAAWLRQLCLDCGADDAGIVEISRPALDDQRHDILRYFPPTKTLLSFVCRMNRQPIRSPARSVANLEFHHAGDHVNEVARKVVAKLEGHGVRAVNPSMGFPMERDPFRRRSGSSPTSRSPTPDLRVTADSQWWLGFLAKERSLLWGLLRRKLRLKGFPRLLLAFGRCFPS
jgi:hypothetical protein